MEGGRGRVEVASRNGWLPLRADAPVVVGESELFSLRNLAPDADVEIGGERVRSSAEGAAAISLKDSEQIRGHLGLIEVRVNGLVVGEIDVVPDKLSEASYRVLRGDLERVWSGLVLDPHALNRLQAAPPPPDELWRRIEGSVRSIAAAPRHLLVEGQVARRHDRARHPRELTPSVQRAALRNGAGLARITKRTLDTPENRMVADTLHRLRAHATRHADGASVATQVGMLLHEEAFTQGRHQHHESRPTWGMRSDQRYRRVYDVRRVLMRPGLEPTEGPGELRLGVKGIIRLYEYWVYLQVLLQCSAALGPPEPPGFDVLAVRLSNGRSRLELRAGTTVTFPGGVHVAFEPTINTRGDGWMGLEYVPHPDPARFQSMATPDVVIFRRGAAPAVEVIDAKYVGRHWVERAAADTHAKYARMRYEGTPAVRHVVVAHPHPGINTQWAGHGSLTMCPGEPVATPPFHLGDGV